MELYNNTLLPVINSILQTKHNKENIPVQRDTSKESKVYSIYYFTYRGLGKNIIILSLDLASLTVKH